MGEIKIPPGQNFGLLALKASVSIAEDVLLPDGYHVLARPPIGFPDYWKEWLGSIKAEQLRDSGTTALVTGRDPAEELALRAGELMTGILLHGCFRTEGGLLVGGDNRGERPEIRTVEEIPPIHIVEGAIARRPTSHIMEDAWKISQNLRSEFRADQHAFPRLSRGLGSWKRGIFERILEERLHEFVRVLDAVMVLPPGEGKKKFAHRGQTFIGKSEDNRTLLSELYDLRSCTEHMNDADNALGAYLPEEREAVLFLRCFQVEQIATEIYRRLLLSDELRSYFSDDKKAESLWRMSEAEQQRLWGDPIDLDALAKARFLDRNTAMPPTRLRPPRATPGGSLLGAGGITI